MPFAIRGKTYLSALHYYLEAAANVENVACVKVLLANGASVLSCDAKGLPLIYFILSDRDHVFRKVFIETLGMQLQNPAFYSKIIACLERYVEAHIIEAIELEKINIVINICLKNIHFSKKIMFVYKK